VMFALAVVFTTNVFANDDVFVDEGDGDFDTMALTPKADAPAAAPAEKPAVAAQKPAPAPAPDTQAIDDELATPTIVDEKTEAPAPAPVQAKKEAPAPSLSNEDLFNDEDPAAKSNPVAEEEHAAPLKKEKPAKKVVEHKEKKHVEHKAEHKVAKHSAPKDHKVTEHKVAHHSAKPTKGKGHFAWTTGNCKLQRAPASEKSMGETSASRKIWVEDVDTEWVKVWNKAGEEAFLSRDCLK